jgi:hypothetical protein
MDFTEKIFEMGPRDVLLNKAAEAQGYRNKGVGPFLSLKAAARYFGLVEYDKDYISVSEHFIKVLLGKSANIKKIYIQKSILSPSLYKKLFDKFGEKQLPDDDDLAKILNIDEQYGISRDASISAAKIFRESAQYAELLDNNNYLRLPDLGESKSYEKSGQEATAIQVEVFKDEARKYQNSLDRYEITLQGGTKITLLLPPVLTQKDKKRLIAMIDLIPEAIDNEGKKDEG